MSKEVENLQKHIQSLCYEHDKENIFPDPISDAQFRREIINFFLGEDWYVVNPIGQEQVNTEALYCIEEKYMRYANKNYKKKIRKGEI